MRNWIRERFAALGRFVRRMFRAVAGIFVELPPETNPIALPPDPRGWEWLEEGGEVREQSANVFVLPSPPTHAFPRFQDEVATLTAVVSRGSLPLDEARVPPYVQAELGDGARIGNLPLGEDVRLRDLPTSSDKLGEGGEALVTRVVLGRSGGGKRGGDAFAFKKFHPPDSPVYQGEGPEKELERENAERRLREYPRKLREFPKLPPRVVAPKHIVVDGGNVVGYLMPLVEFSCTLEKLLPDEEREKQHLNLNDLIEIFLDIHDTIHECHAAGIVIGDLKPENLLCTSKAAYLVDAESMAFNGWSCWKFTDQWADPNICDPDKPFPERVHDPTPDSDWYIFAAMLVTAIMGVGPYEGTLLDNGKLIQNWDRAKQGLSIFNDGVILPRIAKPKESLSQTLIALFKEIFNEGRRGEFPRQVLEEMHCVSCECGEEFCGAACGVCGSPRTVNVPRRVSTVEKPLTLDGNGSIAGSVLATSFHGEKLQALVFRDGVLYREDGSPIGKIDPKAYDKYIVLGARTALVTNGTCIILDPKSETPLKIEGIDDGLLETPLVAGAQDSFAAVVGGTLLVGDLDDQGGLSSAIEIPDKGELWMGEKFGLVLSDRFGTPIKLFTFKSSGTAKEVSDLPSINGVIAEMRAYFGSKTVWLALHTTEMERDHRYLLAIDQGGELVAWTKVSDREIPTWFRSLDAKAAVDDGERRILLSGTRSGLFRLEVFGEKIVEEGILTGISVDPDSTIYPHANGLYEVTSVGIRNHVLARESVSRTDDDIRSPLQGEVGPGKEESERETLRISN